MALPEREFLILSFTASTKFSLSSRFSIFLQPLAPILSQGLITKDSFNKNPLESKKFLQSFWIFGKSFSVKTTKFGEFTLCFLKQLRIKALSLALQAL